MNVKTLRGKQVNIGKLVIQIPQSIPQTDEEIIGHEATIALIKAEIAGPEAMVSFAKKVVDLLHEDITDAMMQREKEARTGVKENGFEFDDRPAGPRIASSPPLQIEGPRRKRGAKG